MKLSVLSCMGNLRVKSEEEWRTEREKGMIHETDSLCALLISTCLIASIFSYALCTC